MRASALMFAAVLLYGPPTVLLTTSTRTWHEATPLFIAAPVTVTVPVPAAAVTKAGPAAKPAPAGQLLCTLGVPATTAFAGSVSVKLMPLCAGLPAPLVIVKVSVDGRPTSRVGGENALFGDAFTNVSAWLVTPLIIPAMAVTFPAALV